MAQALFDTERTLELLNELLWLDRELVEAYELALERIESPLHRERIASFTDDHRQHIEELLGVIDELGGVPAEPAAPNGGIADAKQQLRATVGDQAILRMLRTTEDRAHAFCSRVLERLPESFCALVRRGLNGEHEHRVWLIRRLGVLEQITQP